MAMMWRVATSGYAEVWLRSLALGTRLASGLGRAREKYVFVPYRELAYVKIGKMLKKPVPEVVLDL